MYQILLLGCERSFTAIWNWKISCQIRQKTRGIITEKDIARSVSVFSGKPIDKILVRDIISKNLITVSPDDSVFEIQSVLFNNRISRVVVTKNKKPVGIITYRDFVPVKTLHNEYVNPMERDVFSDSHLNEFNVNQLSYLLAYSAKDIMTKDLFVVYSDNDVYTAAIIMIRQDISGIPVIKNEKLIGMITKSDIVNVLASKGKLG